MNFSQQIKSQSVSNAGNGLFNTSRIAAGKEIFHLDQPLVYVLDSPNLQTTCANCLRKAEVDTTTNAVEDILKRCMGCKIVKYCDTDCQRQSFKLGHRYECKIFSALYPNVLPNTVRLLLQLLLRRQKQSLNDETWSAFLSLQSHTADFQAQRTKNEDGLTTWQTIELLSQATAKYSGTKEPMENILGMVARVLINSHTLTTPTLDPLGLCLSPQSALLNHSCTPNAHIVFSNQRLTVRSLTPLEPATELTISYIDTAQPTLARQSELRTRYFFTCTCPSCSAGTTNGAPDPAITPAEKQIEDRATVIQAEAAKLPPAEAGEKLQSALGLLMEHPPYRQPYASIMHNTWLNAVARQDWSLAVQYALRAYFDVEPVQFPLEWHPVRVVRKWVLLRLLVNCAMLAQGGDGSVQGLGEVGIEWAVVIRGVWMEVSRGVGLSHGEDNVLTREVRTMGENMSVSGADGGSGREWDIAVQREWAKLRSLADGRSAKLQSLAVR